MAFCFKKTALFFQISILLALGAGCTSRQMRAQEMQTDLSFREIRSQLEEQKYQMNRYEVEQQIIEGKIDTQNNLITTLRQELSNLGSNNDSLIESTLTNYEKRLEKLEMLNKNLQEELASLKENTSDVLSSLSQYKNKIDFNEQKAESQERTLGQIKSSVDVLMDQYESNYQDDVYYTVSLGDTLENIALAHQTSIEKIKELNNLKGNLVVAGQKLRIK